MYLASLMLSKFRNYQELQLDFSPGLNVIYGDNAQGKTNLLEAVYVLATGKSHRTSRDQELILEGADALTARAMVVRKTGDMSLELTLGHETRKQVKINGVAEKKIAHLVGNVAAVLFSPDDLQLLKGSPSGRRRFLDIELSQISQTYLHHLMSYNRTMTQRNTLLKQDTVDQALLSIYDEQLLASGAQLVVRRAQAVQRLSKIASQYHGMLAEGKEELRLEYQSQGAEPDQTPGVAEVTERLYSQLQQRRREEIRRQVTLVGPHRDDIGFWINDRDAKLYGSQGQQRTAVLALKMAELQFMAEEIGEYPVLLLDDVASELDPTRRHYLFSAVREGIQTFVTCTDLDDLMVRSWHIEHRLFRVRTGTVERDSRGLE
ncbi:MAG TPA: DNA replication/repair protein RecF [Symbiobacteriaceae bacterium]|nr:DNA replication/repair protein RecF [Symbiobacteriaceae bacterium]